MDKDIMDYLKYYLGCEVVSAEGKTGYTLNKIGVNGFASFKDKDGFDMWLGTGWKLALRKIESMTDAEGELLNQVMWGNFVDAWYTREDLITTFTESPSSYRPGFSVTVAAINWLRENGFDVDNLIIRGAAINKEQQ